MHPTLNIAIEAALAAGEMIVRRMDQAPNLAVTSKGRNDFVTDVDRRAEALILSVIRKAYPDHAVLAEESGNSGKGDMQWIVDPLDGTTNFLHGCPQFSVSIAFRHKKQIIHAVIYDPLRMELYTASRGRGAHLNNRRIRVSKLTRIDNALVGTGFPFRKLERTQSYLHTLEKMCHSVAGVRRFGSAALDLAYVACGRLDGFWEFDLHVWDIAAGVLLIEEAGGLVSDMEGKQRHMESGHVLAGSPKIHEKMLKLLQRCRPAA